MDSRERTFLALNFEESDRIPIDFWGTTGFGAGFCLTVFCGAGALSGSFSEQPDANDRNSSVIDIHLITASTTVLI